MCQALGYRVVALHRVRIMHVTLAGLSSGRWKPLTTEEQQELLCAVRRSSASHENAERS
jgi:23S rRNA pseudouridine2604 synthase